MFSIEVDAVKADCTPIEQIAKIREEFYEWQENYSIEELCDLIQAGITFLQNNTSDGLQNIWKKHLEKMDGRNWKAR